MVNRCQLEMGILFAIPNAAMKASAVQETMINLSPVLTPTTNVIRISDTTVESTRFYRVIQP
jgi:hypothetical protein